MRAVTRDPGSARFPTDVEVVSSAADGAAGADALFLNSRALGCELSTVVERARSTGVRRLVALSAINADDDYSRQPSRFRGDRNKETEQLAVDSGLEWVSLRPTVFASNFAGMWSQQVQSGDVVVGPFASASTAVIVDRDISAVAARALLDDDLLGRRVAMTGPQALTNTALVEVLGTVLNRPLRYQEVPPEAVRARFVAMGFPAAVRRRLPRPAGPDGRRTGSGDDGGGADSGPAGGIVRRLGRRASRVVRPVGSHAVL